MNQTLASKSIQKNHWPLPRLNTSARSKPAQIQATAAGTVARAQKLVELVCPDGPPAKLRLPAVRKSCACSSCARAEQTGQ